MRKLETQNFASFKMENYARTGSFKIIFLAALPTFKSLVFTSSFIIRDRIPLVNDN